LGSFFPTEWKNKLMFQTTNQDNDNPFFWGVVSLTPYIINPGIAHGDSNAPLVIPTKIKVQKLM